jgi:hypothetical protein
MPLLTYITLTARPTLLSSWCHFLWTDFLVFDLTVEFRVDWAPWNNKCGLSARCFIGAISKRCYSFIHVWLSLKHVFTMLIILEGHMLVVEKSLNKNDDSAQLFRHNWTFTGHRGLLDGNTHYLARGGSTHALPTLPGSSRISLDQPIWIITFLVVPSNVGMLFQFL